MGKHKALLEFDGATLAARAAGILGGVADQVFIVGSEVSGYPFISDLLEAKTSPAAIFGVQAALHHSPTVWTALLACDLPFVSADLFRLLLTVAESATVDAVVPEQPDGRPQPLAALYRTNPCREAVDEIVAADERRMGALLEKIDCRRVLLSEYSSLPGSDLLFVNVNTPDEYRAALRIAENQHQKSHF